MMILFELFFVACVFAVRLVLVLIAAFLMVTWPIFAVLIAGSSAGIGTAMTMSFLVIAVLYWGTTLVVMRQKIFGGALNVLGDFVFRSY